MLLVYPVLLAFVGTYSFLISLCLILINKMKWKTLTITLTLATYNWQPKIYIWSLGRCRAVFPLQRSERLEVVPTAGTDLLMYPLTALFCAFSLGFMIQIIDWGQIIECDWQFTLPKRHFARLSLNCMRHWNLQLGLRKFYRHIGSSAARKVESTLRLRSIYNSKWSIPKLSWVSEKFQN